MPKKVLIISYHFPPDSSIGALRPAKFTEYLPDFNWQPIVLTVKDKSFANLDNQFKCDCKVYKTGKIPSLREIYLFIKGLCIFISKHGEIKQYIQDWHPPKENRNELILKRIKRNFIAFVFRLPDDKIGWILPAVISGLKIIIKYKIDVIYTTSPPHSCHLIGLILKYMSRKPWITDFRDPWVGGVKPFFMRSKISDIIERWLEKQVVLKSDQLISATPEMTEMFRKRYTEANNNKFSTIWNGYDPKDVASLQFVKKNDKFTFAYTGSFYLARNPGMFLRSLQKLINSKIIDKERIHVKFI